MAQNIKIALGSIKTPTNTLRFASDFLAKMRAGQRFTVDEIQLMPKQERVKIIRMMW